MARSARTAVVTGASAGIGAALARTLAGAGYRLALGARRLDRLEEVAGEARAHGATVHCGALDITEAASVDAFFAASEESLGVADVVVNNAGASRPASFHEYDVEWLRTEVATNFLGPILVTHRALRPLREQGLPGDLVFVSSDAIHAPRPRQVLYGAAKAGIEHLADGLARELEGTGIRVTKVRAGPTLTEFGAAWDLSPETLAERTAYWKRFGLRDARLLGALLRPEDVAQAVLDALERPPGVWIDTIEVRPAAPRDAARDGDES